jgi:hypothetical protein
MSGWQGGRGEEEKEEEEEEEEEEKEKEEEEEEKEEEEETFLERIRRLSCRGLVCGGESQGNH